MLKTQVHDDNARHLEIFREGSELQRDEAVQYLKEVGLYLDHVE